jgi:predicted nucleotidyltransferase
MNTTQYIDRHYTKVDTPCDLSREIIFDALKDHLTHLELEDVLNIYIYGSRLYGTAKQDSDYDTMVVLTDKSFTNKVVRLNPNVTAMKPEERKTGFIQVEKNGLKLDMTTYSLDQFIYRLNTLFFHESTQLWFPTNFKVESFDPIIYWNTFDENNKPIIELPMLRTRFTLRAEANWKEARRFFQQALTHESEELRLIDVHKGKKGMISVIRMYLMCTQIAKYGRIVDWACANKLMDHEFVIDHQMQDYQLFYDTFNAFRIDARKELAEIVPWTVSGETI